MPSADLGWWLPLFVAPFIGSFLGMLIQRLPAGRPWMWARSACSVCGHRLAVLDLVPLVSWLAIGGRCRHCGAGIPWFYPLIELAAFAVAIWAVLAAPGAAWATCLLGWMLLALAAIDLRHYLLPDALTLPLLVAGLAEAFLDDPLGLAPRCIGAAAGFCLFTAVAFAYRRWRGRDGLGEGDGKLLAAAGAWVSWEGLPSVILIGAIASFGLLLIQRQRGRPLGLDTALPFGPGLCLGTWLVWLYGPLS